MVVHLSRQPGNTTSSAGGCTAQVLIERARNALRRSLTCGLLSVVLIIAGNGQTVASAGPAPPGLAAKIDALQHLLDAQARQIAQQQKQIEELRQALQGTGTEPSRIAPSSPTATAAPHRAEARAKRPEDRLKNPGPLRVSGDFRFREENFAGGPPNRSKVLNRLRYRLRVNATTHWNQDFSAGFALATGDVNNPVSTNQTASEFYTRKPFNLDRAFLSYNPRQFNRFTLTMGKFAYPFYRTELTWDKDINPEGVAQTLVFRPTAIAPLQKLSLVGFELPFSEAGGVSLHDKSIVQSAVYGGQVQTEWKLATRAKLEAYTAYFDYHNADPIALALQIASAKNPQSPLSGLSPLYGNGFVQNSMIVTRGANILTVNGTGDKTGVTSIANAQFASKFGLLDTIAQLDIKTPAERWPVRLLGDFVQNTRACANLRNIHPLPANTGTEVFTQTMNAPCDPHQRHGYWLEGRAGRLEKDGDYQLAYTRIFIEREAVMSGFDFSELIQGSNVSGHRVEFRYNLQNDVELALTGLFSRPLANPGTPKQPFLSRLQMDVIYRF